MTKYNQLNKDERDTIQYMLDNYKTNFMLIRLMDKKNIVSVNKEFDTLKSKC